MIDLDNKLNQIEVDKQRKRAWYEANRERLLKEKKKKYEANRTKPKRTRRTPDEERAAQREWYRKNSDACRERARLNRLKLSPEKKSEYRKSAKDAYRKRREQDFEKLAGRPRAICCEGCGKIDGGKSNGTQRKYGTVFDHDHKTGKFRGWLCAQCNSALGLLNDDPALLRKYALYLENGGFSNLNSTNEPRLV